MQIIFQQVLQSDSNDAKMLSAMTVRHFWLLGNVLSERSKLFIETP